MIESKMQAEETISSKRTLTSMSSFFDGAISSLAIHFPTSPISNNEIHASRRGQKLRFLSKKAKHFKKNVDYVMQQNSKVIENFVSHWDRDTMAIEVRYLYFINKDLCTAKVQNKETNFRFRERRSDVGNFEKWSTDCLCANLQIDDAFVWKISQEKHPSLGESSFLALIKIVKLQDVIVMSSSNEIVDVWKNIGINAASFDPSSMP